MGVHENLSSISAKHSALKHLVMCTITQDESLLHQDISRLSHPAHICKCPPSWSWDVQSLWHKPGCLYALTCGAGLMLQLPSQQRARAARTPRGGRSTPRHVSNGARPAHAPRRVCFSPCTPDVLDHSHAPASAPTPLGRAAHAQKETPRVVPLTSRSAAGKTNPTQSAPKVRSALNRQHLCCSISDVRFSRLQLQWATLPEAEELGCRLSPVQFTRQKQACSL